MYTVYPERPVQVKKAEQKVDLKDPEGQGERSTVVTKPKRVLKGLVLNGRPGRTYQIDKTYWIGHGQHSQRVTTGGSPLNHPNLKVPIYRSIKRPTSDSCASSPRTTVVQKYLKK